MKKLIGILLAVSVILSTMAISFFAVSAETEEGFVVDGNLDIWYLTRDDEDWLMDRDDYSNYHYYYLDAISKMDGVSPVDMEDVSTFGEFYTAYDDTYVYVYVKVWDDNLIDWDPALVDQGYNSSAADSIEIWFDPDRNSQTHYADGTPKERPTDGWYNQTGDETQGDIQVRLIGYDMERHDYHNKVKPGYNGIIFSEWVNNPENFCGFYFDNEPITLDNGLEISSGYGVEARFPRNDSYYGPATYALNVCANNSSKYSSQQYALSNNTAWWMNYNGSCQINYNDELNPFFNQPADVLAAKKVAYTDSEINTTGVTGKLVEDIAALPETVSESDKATVEALVASYKALNDTQKGYIVYKNYDVLYAAAQALGVDAPAPGESAGSEITLADVEAMIAALPDEMEKLDRTAVDAIANAMDSLSDEDIEAMDEDLFNKFVAAVAYFVQQDMEKNMGNVNGDESINAADALLVLQAAVGKTQLDEMQELYADVNGDTKIDASDALEILQVAVGKKDHFSIFDMMPQ